MRVSLSSIRPEDSEILFRWINDPETVRFNAPYRPVHWASHEAWVRAVGASPHRQVLAIREGDRLVGVVQLIDIDPIHRSAELTIRIGDRADRGHGFGTEALRLAVDFAWRDLNLHRVWVRVFATNPRAIRAYRKAGFVEEGRLRRRPYSGSHCPQGMLGFLGSERRAVAAEEGAADARRGGGGTGVTAVARAPQVWPARIGRS